MVFGPSRLGLEETAAVRGAPPGRAQNVAAPRTDEVSTSIPVTPPAEVLNAVDTAARVLEELASRRISLRFQYDDEANQVRVQVVDENDGHVVREIPPSVLLDIAEGSDLPTAA